MAQLRDAQTSHFIAAGDPIDMVHLAEEIGRDEVLFDDVGEHFDPDLVLKTHQENLEGHRRALEAEKDPDLKKFFKARVKELEEVAPQASKKAPHVKRILDAARSGEL